MGGSIEPATGARFVGPVSYWVDELARTTELGVDAFLFWPTGEDRESQIDTFAAEVAPAVRCATETLSRPP